MSENIKEEIIRHTLKLIASKGFDGFSIDELITAVGCSKGIVFYHFGDRENLIQEAFVTFLNYYNSLATNRLKEEKKAVKMLRVLTKVLTTPEIFDVSNANSLSMNIDSGDYPRLLVNFYYLCLKNEKAALLQKEMYESYFNGIRQIIKFGIKKGEFKPKEDIDEIILGYSAIIDGLVLYKSMSSNNYNDELADSVIKNYWKRTLKF
jgi:AcrR family transcriptional regulator